MNLKPIFLGCLCLVALTANAQAPASGDYKLVWGGLNSAKLSNYWVAPEFIDADESGVYLIQTPYRKFTSNNVLGGIRDYKLARYDAKMMIAPITADLNLKTDGAEREYEFVSRIGNTSYIFSSFKNRKLKKTFLFAQTLDKKNLKLSETLKKVVEIDYSQEGKYDATDFKISLSNDKSKVLIYYSLVDNGDTVGFGFWVLDQSLNSLWNSENNLPLQMGEDQVFQTKQYTVDNKGDVYLLGAMYDSEKDLSKNQKLKKKNFFSSTRRAERQANYKFYVVSYSKKGTSAQSYGILADNKFITDLKMGINDKQDIILAGFYAEPAKTDVRGTAFFRIPKDSKMIAEKGYDDFGDFITEGMNEKEIAKVKKSMADGEKFDLFNYNIEDIQFMANGSYTLIAEKTRMEEHTTGGKVRTTYYDHFDNDIIVINYSPKGTVNWKKKIDKDHRTTGTNRFYASYIFDVKSGKIYFLYNDMPPKGNSYSSFKKANLRLTSIDDKGTIKSDIVSSAEKDKVAVQSWFYRKINGEIYFIAAKGAKYMIGKLSSK